ncbi:hypothetical protein LTS18_000366, partial [Coniosporium uncinatum]
VITRWYRAPEVFYQAPVYGGSVDVWSMGMVFAEVILRRPFVFADTDIEMVHTISQAIGTPTEENWPGVSSLPAYIPVAKESVVPLRQKDYWMSHFNIAGSAGVDLLMRMLTLDPRKRATAKQMLQHEWFATAPRPTAKENLPKKAGGEKKVGEDLKRRAGEMEEGRADKVARKIDFGAMKK